MRSPLQLFHQQPSKMKPCPAKNSACSGLPTLSQPDPGPRALLLSPAPSPHMAFPLPSRLHGCRTAAFPLPRGCGVNAELSLGSLHSGHSNGGVPAHTCAIQTPLPHHVALAPWGQFGGKNNSFLLGSNLSFLKAT